MLKAAIFDIETIGSRLKQLRGETPTGNVYYSVPGVKEPMWLKERPSIDTAVTSPVPILSPEDRQAAKLSQAFGVPKVGLLADKFIKACAQIDIHIGSKYNPSKHSEEQRKVLEAAAEYIEKREVLGWFEARKGYMNCLGHGIHWSDMPEGVDFWYRIYMLAEKTL